MNIRNKGKEKSYYRQYLRQVTKFKKDKAWLRANLSTSPEDSPITVPKVHLWVTVATAAQSRSLQQALWSQTSAAEKYQP